MQIFPNGQIYFGYKGNDIGDDGLPVREGERHSIPYTCTISTLSEDKKGRYDDGRYKRCTYSVLMELDEYQLAENTFPLTFGFSFKAEFSDLVNLTHDLKGHLGKFQVQRIEYYTLTNTIELWV